MLHHVGDDPETTLGVLKVLVLDSGLDHVEGSRDDERGTSTGDRGDKVLPPGSRVVVAKLVEIFLGRSRTTKQLVWYQIEVMRYRVISTYRK